MGPANEEAQILRYLNPESVVFAVCGIYTICQ
jgi:hypothetical protein